MTASDTSLRKLARDNIQNIEGKLRDTVSKIMSTQHGLDWETKPGLAFSPKDIQEMDRRRTVEYNTFGRPMSNRLLDYSYIIDLKRIIIDNWQEFAGIFPSRNTTSVYFDNLNTLRNPLEHLRQGVTEQQCHLVIGICGEISRYIDAWNDGYRHQVLSYYCEFRFPVYPVGGDSKAAQAKAAQRAAEWSNKIEGLSLQPVSPHEGIDFGEERLIHLANGQARISVPHNVPPI
jgi:hypothetical protein